MSKVKRKRERAMALWFSQGPQKKKRDTSQGQGNIFGGWGGGTDDLNWKSWPPHPWVILRLPSSEFFARFVWIFRPIISLGKILGENIYNYDYLECAIMLPRRIRTVNKPSRQRMLTRQTLRGREAPGKTLPEQGVSQPFPTNRHRETKGTEDNCIGWVCPLEDKEIKLRTSPLVPFRLYSFILSLLR